MDDVTKEFRDRLVAEFQQRAHDRAQESSPAAGVYERVATDIAKMFEAFMTEPITPAEGARLSGYTARGLRAWMKRAGVTTLTRATLPRKIDDDAAQVSQVEQGITIAPELLQTTLEPPTRRRRARRVHTAPARSRVADAMLGAMQDG
jgi:hypothetical protein